MAPMSDENPTSVDARQLLELAGARRQSGRVEEAIALYRRALALDPQLGEAWFRLAQIATGAGQLDQARVLLEKAVAADPAAGAYRFRLGVLLLNLGDRDGAVEAFQAAFLARPELATAQNNVNLPEAARREIAAANALLRGKYVELLDQTMTHMRARHGAGDLERLERCFHFLSGQEEKTWCHPQQRPEFLLFPDMPAQPWFDPHTFEWTRRLEDAYPAVLAECEAVLAQRDDFEPYVDHARSEDGEALTRSGIDVTSLAGSRSWTAWHLVRGRRLDDRCARCPDTAAVVESLPLANVPGYMPDVLFSLLEPGAMIQPHYGQNNVRLTVHLGLRVPDGCALKVGDESRPWQAGKVLMFDDSFLHEAWNRSDEDRVVLIFKVWNPALTAAEIEGLEHFFATRNAWLARFEAKA